MTDPVKLAMEYCPDVDPDVTLSPYDRDVYPYTEDDIYKQFYIADRVADFLEMSEERSFTVHRTPTHFIIRYT